jgi:glycogen operon protein
VNFVTCHDGFTLNDLVSYDHKHNEANKEDNRDGASDNISWNCGAEGSSDDVAINELRERKKRSFLATLMFSQGVPMLLAGDEISHTQQGNNNAYCQDNELTWLNWNLDERRQALLDFTQRLVEIRAEQPVLQRRRYFHGSALEGESATDLAWLNVDGTEMAQDAWTNGFTKCLGLVLFGDSVDVDEYGGEISGDTLLIIFNGDHGEPIPFTLPELEERRPWERIIDTADPDADEEAFDAGHAYPVQPAALALFRLRTEDTE